MILLPQYSKIGTLESGRLLEGGRLIGDHLIEVGLYLDIAASQDFKVSLLFRHACEEFARVYHDRK